MRAYSLARRSSFDIGPPTSFEKRLPILPHHIWLFSKLKQGCKSLVRYWWAWEILAAVLSIISTIVLIVVLARNDGHPVQSLFLGGAQVTLNTIVAAISTIIRASLMVTVAGALNQSAWNWFSFPASMEGRPSGRPLKDLDTFGYAAFDSWSSLKLLFKTRGTALASLGALITVLSLAFDTFSQQVLTTETQSAANDTISSSSLSLPRSTNYSEQWIHGQNRVADASFSTYAGVMSTIINSNFTMPSGVCPSNNCTWPTTPTLGVCSSCTDVKDSLTSTSNGNSTNYTLPWPDMFATRQVNLLGVRSGAQSTNITFSTSSFEFNYSLATLRHADPVANLTPDGRLVISMFNMLGISPLAFQNFTPPRDGEDDCTSCLPQVLDAMVTAYQCSFHFCLQSFNASTETGQSQQQQVSKSERWQDPWMELGTPWTFERGDSEGTAILDFNSVRIPAEPPATMNIPNVSEYQVQWGSLSGLAYALGDILDGDVSVSALNTKQPQFTIAGAPNVGAAFVQAFWNASNSTQTMSALSQQIADSFTSFMRTSVPADPDPLYTPTVFTTQTIVRVRWPWLIFPLGLLIAGHMFLLAIIWQTRHRSIRPWKGQRVPLLLASIDDTIKDYAVGGYGSRTGLEERVGQIQVRLEYDGADEIAFRRMY